MMAAPAPASAQTSCILGAQVAAIFEFSGAVLLGGGVASTIMNRITDRGLFSDNPELLMIGMCCTELSTAIWLTTG